MGFEFLEGRCDFGGIGEKEVFGAVGEQVRIGGEREGFSDGLSFSPEGAGVY